MDRLDLLLYVLLRYAVLCDIVSYVHCVVWFFASSYSNSFYLTILLTSSYIVLRSFSGMRVAINSWFPVEVYLQATASAADLSKNRFSDVWTFTFSYWQSSDPAVLGVLAGQKVKGLKSPAAGPYQKTRILRSCCPGSAGWPGGEGT